MIAAPPAGFRRRGSCAEVRKGIHALIRYCLEIGAITGGGLPDGRTRPQILDRLARLELAVIAAIEDLANFDPDSDA